MTLTFVTNLIHHHQLPLADEFYKILGNNYHYIATKAMPDWLIKGGYNPALDRPYIIRTYEGEEQMKKARQLVDDSEVVIMGDSPSDWAIKRKKEGKVTFHFMERIYKKRVPWLKLPRHAYLNYLNYGRYKNTYLLCASAFASYDFSLSFCFIGKSFKWGYMTAVDSEFNHEALNYDIPNSQSIPMMWCARFLRWKHPELPVQLAARLKEEGYKFKLDMFGSGEELESTKWLAAKLNVEDCVSFCGNRPNEEILKEMKKHSIFLFTSDRYEGWGAVLNEAMSNGCAVVASNKIGSAPYLIENGKNGLLFESESIKSLYLQTKTLLDDRKLREEISQNAIRTMKEVWNPLVAAERFLHLCDRLIKGLDTDYKEGPCSKA